MAGPLAAPVGPADSSLNQISLEYSYADIQHATRNFDMSTQLGSGSFGGVYKGIQRDGTEVAVKVLEIPEESGFEEEVRVLSKFRHPNLVILMGFARNEDQRLLVYELLAGGDVYRRLQKSCLEGVPFTWRQRVSAAFDAACGLSHLHHASPKVFHRDIKSPNILLDRNGTAKMADFGLACITHADGGHKVAQASGTVGYACPLYVQRGVVTEGSEIYSFGIVMLELLTASPPACVTQAADGSQSYSFIVTHIGGSPQVAMSLADPKAAYPAHVMHPVAELALRCTAMPEEVRPGFAEVVNLLRTLRDLPDAPVQVQSTVTASASHQNSLYQGVYAQAQAQAQAQQVQVQAQAQAQPHLHIGLGRVVSQGQSQYQQTQQQYGIHESGIAAGGISPHAQNPQVNYQQRQVQPQQQHAAMPQMIAPGVYQVNAQQAPMPARQYHAPAQVQLPPALWTLECVRSQGLVGDGIDSGRSKEQLCMVHRHEPGGPLLTTLRVGRLFQDDFFTSLIPEEEARGAVSREHFQIWAEEMPAPGPAPVGGIPCYFFLTNYSVNGTLVNGAHLKNRGEQIGLHIGDIISFARLLQAAEGPALTTFLEFRFELAGSILTDADAFAAGECPVTANNAAFMKPKGTKAAPAPPVGVAVNGRSPTKENAVEGGSSSSACTSFIGNGLEPMFVLEAGGTAVREGLMAEHRRIVHGPKLRTGADAEPCPPLVLGRAQQQVFWQRLLIDEAFNALSRQHVQIEVCDDGPHPIFCVRNLSERNPIRVSGSLEDCAESARPLEPTERRPLSHGDVIVVNPNKGNTLWLVFRDIMAGRAAPPATCTTVPPQDSSRTLSPCGNKASAFGAKALPLPAAAGGANCVHDTAAFAAADAAAGAAALSLS